MISLTSKKAMKKYELIITYVIPDNHLDIEYFHKYNDNEGERLECSPDFYRAFVESGYYKDDDISEITWEYVFVENTLLPFIEKKSAYYNDLKLTPYYHLDVDDLRLVD